MIIDSLLNVSKSQVLGASGASTDVIDFGVTQQNVGPGRPLYLVAVLKEVSGSSPTINVAFQCDDNAGFASPATKVTSETLTSPKVGTKIFLALPVTNERFGRAYYTVGGGTPSFTLDTFITDEPPTANVPFPDGI